MHHLYSYEKTNCRHLDKNSTKLNFEDLTYKLESLDILI